MTSKTGAPTVPAEASPSPASAGHPSNVHMPQKPARILACVLCQHRKIKCDRSFPCANCLKANVTCTPSTPAPARKRRRPNQDLQERLARCEELLKEYATAKPASPSSARSPSPKRARSDGVPSLENTLPRWKPAGKLIEEDGGLRFMDSYLLGTVYDELKSMRKLVDDELACDESTPAPATDDFMNSPDGNAELMFGNGETPLAIAEDLTPSPSHIARLWQIFLDRCNPLTKIIHVPTMQPYLLEATGSSPNLPKNIEALLFAIYTLAVVSMTKEECEEILGIQRDRALAKFSQGVRACLTRLSFLKTHDLFTLQALVIYLISLQGRYNRHASWILNGIVIRIAQKMGLHRDGELLGLKPFETEMRRRLWWQIIMIDAKYAMLSGLSHTLLPRGWDTKEPKNINDADLLPSATEPIKDSEGPTDMILVLTVFKIAKHLIQIPGIETVLVIIELQALRDIHGPNKEKVDEYRSVIRQLNRDLEEIFSRFSSPTAGELHQLARQLKEHIMKKLSALITLPTESPDWSAEVYDHSSNAFKLAVDSTAHGVEQHKIAMYPAWEWFHRLHFQFDIFAYLVGQLSTRTTGRLVDQAWQVVDDVFQHYPEFYDTSQRAYHQLAYFVFRAWRKREAVLSAQLGHPPEVPQCVQKLRQIMPGSDDSSLKNEPGKTPTNEMFNPVTGDIGISDRGNRALEFGGADGGFSDMYLGNYFDLNGMLDFDIWGNTAVPNPAPGQTQVPDVYPYVMGPQSEW